jgi:hypothetical protein
MIIAVQKAVNVRMAERAQTAIVNVQLDSRIAERAIPLLPASILPTAINIADAMNPTQARIVS